MKSPAKINLSLRVGEKINGYHEVESEVMMIRDLHDIIQIQPSSTNAITTSVPIEGNILEDCFNLISLKGVTDKFVVHIKKNIPMGAGLGGGSSNAGTFLKWINQRYGVDFSADELQKIGSDVAIFYQDYDYALCTGYGEKVREIDCPQEFKNKKPKLIMLPIHLSTAKVFAEFKPSDRGQFANDLTPAAIRLEPKIAEILEDLSHSYSTLGMSGSGSTCFGFEIPN